MRIIWLQILPWEVFQKYPGSSLPPSDVLLIPLEEARRPLSCFYQQKVILSRHPDRYVHKQNEIKQLKQKNLQKKNPTPFCHYVSTRKQQLLISISSKQKVSLINYAYGIMQKQFCAGNVKWSEVVSSTKGLFWSPHLKAYPLSLKYTWILLLSAHFMVELQGPIFIAIVIMPPHY